LAANPPRQPAASRSHARRTRTLGSRDADLDGCLGVDETLPDSAALPASTSSAGRLRDNRACPASPMRSNIGTAAALLALGMPPTRTSAVQSDVQYLTGPAADLGR